MYQWGFLTSSVTLSFLLSFSRRTRLISWVSLSLSPAFFTAATSLFTSSLKFCDNELEIFPSLSVITTQISDNMITEVLMLGARSWSPPQPSRPSNKNIGARAFPKQDNKKAPKCAELHENFQPLLNTREGRLCHLTLPREIYWHHCMIMLQCACW